MIAQLFSQGGTLSAERGKRVIGRACSPSNAEYSGILEAG